MKCCRGEEVRKRIVDDYELRAIAHVKLLNGQVKSSCTNDLLTDSYYCFDYKSRTDPMDTGTFYCGYYAANHFLVLEKLKPLPLFNPLGGVDCRNDLAVGAKSNSRTDISWHPLCKQLNDAINMLVVCWDIIPSGALCDIQTQLLRYPDKKPFMSKIKAVNTIIGRDKDKRTLQIMIDELREVHDIRNFDFSLLCDELDAIGVISNFG